MDNMAPMSDFGYIDDNLHDNLTKERKFGQDIRRLIKIVSSAFLNPSEL